MKFNSKFLSTLAKASLFLVPFLALQSGKISSDISSLASSNQAVFNTANAVSVSTFAQLKSAIAGDAEDIVFANDITCQGSIGDSAITIPSGKTKRIDGKDFVFSAQVTGANEQGILNNNPSRYNLITNNGTLYLSNLTIRGGGKSAVDNEANANIQIDNCTIERASAYMTGEEEKFKWYGGGLLNAGNALVKNSKFSRNNANFGGGFINYGDGAMIMDSCSLNENRSLIPACGGGGGENRGKFLIMNNCTVANNTSTELGGALNCHLSSLTAVVNSTVAGNITTAGAKYGGGFGINGCSIIFANSIASNNYYYNTSASSKEFTDFGFYKTTYHDNLNIIHGAYNHAKDESGEVSDFPNNHPKQIADDGNFYATFVDQSILNPDGSSSPAKFKRPIIVKNQKGTYIAPIKTGSPFCTGGTDIYLNIPSNIGSWSTSNIAFGYYDTDSSTIKPFTYGGTTFKTPVAADKVTVYQDGTTRDSIVMGAARPTNDTYCTITVVPGEHGSVTGASIYGDTYPKGTPISLFAIPDEGYTLKEWKNVETGVTYPPSTFTNYPLNESLIIQPVFTDEGFHLITNLAPESARVQNKGYLKVNPSALKGDEVGIEAVPNKNCVVTSIRAYTEDGDIAIIDGKFTMPDANVTVDAVFKEYRGITNNTPKSAKDVNNGYLEVISSAIEGTQVTITVCPNEGYKVETLKVFKTGDESTLVPVTNNKFTMPDYSVTVSATFKLITFDITNTAPESDKDINHGYVVVDALSVPNVDVNIGIYPNEGYKLETLKVFKTGDEGTTIPVVDNKFTMPEYPVTVSASFKLITYDITNATPESDKDINNGYVVVDSFAAPNTEVTATIAPNDGYKLNVLKVYKTGDESTIVPVEDNKFTMPEYPVTVSASFKLITYDITNNSPASSKDNNHGYVEVDSYAIPGVVVTITTHPNEGYTLDSLKVFKTGEKGITVQVNDGKFTMPSYPVTVKAIFVSVTPIPPSPIPPTDTTCFYHILSLSLMSTGAIFFFSILIFNKEDRYFKYLAASIPNSFAFALAVTGIAAFNCTFCIAMTVVSATLLGVNGLAVIIKAVKGKKKK